MRCGKPQSSASNHRPPLAGDTRFVDRPRAGEARNGAWKIWASSSWLAIVCATLMLAGCAAEPKKKPAGKSKPVATASKSGAKPSATQKPAVKPAAQKQAKAAAPVTAPRTPQERYAQALDLIKASRWTEAETALVAYVKEFPQYSGPRTNLGIVYARTNRKPQAAAEFAKAVSANPKNAAAHTWLGVLAREAGDFKQAELSYRRALAADLQYPAAHLNLAILYDQHMQKPREALASYTRYRELAGAQDLRAAVWVAELERKLKPATSTP